jgi:glucose-6-phosphate isomerase
MPQFNNLDSLEAYKKLQNGKKEFPSRATLSKESIQASSIAAGGGLSFNYGAKGLSRETIEVLQQLADEAELIAKYELLASGEYVNTGENRRVLHHLVRGQQKGEVIHEGENLHEFYLSQQSRIADFCGKIHGGEIKGSTGKVFNTVVQIGIGGSDLGPRALYLALEGYTKPLMQAEFISNVDPDDAAAVLSPVDFETSLFIVVSKSGTTQETLTNLAFVEEALKNSGIPGLDPKKHLVAVTSQTSPMAGNPDYLDSFYIDDFIGGRYSATSAVGGAVLSLAFGPKIFEELLSGAEEADRMAMNPQITENAALADALMGVYERNILNLPSTAILPYSQALSRFPAHLQQLDMESNGKQVNREGKPLSYSTGPVIFGEPGTNGQHSFYQLLHQGTDIIPLQFIGFKESQRQSDMEIDGLTSQKKLNANLAAQIAAFSMGKTDDNLNKNFPGGRPCSLISADMLTPKALGALLAHFENKVMFQGFIWNLNSFDQEGVQLGKVLTNQVLSGAELHPALQAFTEILGL